MDSPRSKVKYPATKSKNWTMSGWFSPRFSRQSSISAGSAYSPVPASRTSQTSPGIARSRKNTSSAAPARVGSIINSRFMT